MFSDADDDSYFYAAHTRCERCHRFGHPPGPTHPCDCEDESLVAHPEDAGLLFHVGCLVKALEEESEAA
jgi:hypothetical protein